MKWLKNNGHSKDEYHSSQLGQQMIEAGIFRATRAEVTGFEPGEFYRFTEHWTEGEMQ